MFCVVLRGGGCLGMRWVSNRGVTNGQYARACVRVGVISWVRISAIELNG
jgi:hypothetical protein